MTFFNKQSWGQQLCTPGAPLRPFQLDEVIISAISSHQAARMLEVLELCIAHKSAVDGLVVPYAKYM